MYKAKAYSARSTAPPLAFTRVARRDPTEHDVQIEVLLSQAGPQTEEPNCP